MRLRTKNNLIIGILFTLLLISAGVITIINFRPLYYFDIKTLHLEANTGLSVADIKQNYDTLIDYCSPFYHGDLTFPTLNSSKEGLIHFEEVKNIFVSFYYIAIFSLAALIPFVIYKCKKKDYSFLKTSSITTVVIPLIVGLACSINFDKSFELFHKLFFRNNYWLFDPVLDPIINLLPEAFFLHCALFIIIFVLLGSLLLHALYKVLS